MSEESDKIEDLRAELYYKAQNISEKMERKGGKYFNLGLCSTCDHLRVIKTVYTTKYLACSAVYEKDTHMRLSEADPVVECFEYNERGQLSLSAMSQMATLIDIPKESNPIGFSVEEEKE